MSKELIERLRNEGDGVMSRREKTQIAARIEELERKVASRDAEIAELKEQRDASYKIADHYRAEREQLREELSRARLQNAVIYGTSHPEMYKTKEDELREQVTLLRDAALKAANHVKPTCGDLYEELMQALAATQDLSGLVLCEAEPVGKYTGTEKEYGYQIVQLDCDVEIGTPLYKASKSCFIL